MLVALLVAFGWNMLTWWLGLPTSSSHALIGALAGAGLAAGAQVDSWLLVFWVGLPMLLSPLLALVGAWLVMLTTARLFRDAANAPAIRGFRIAQSVTAAAVAVGHGLHDGQKTMGVLAAALGGAGVAAGAVDGAATVGGDGPIPPAVRVAVALALGLGTFAGGWRIIRTVSRRLVRMTPAIGFAAQGSTSLVLFVSAFAGGLPVSTTHTVVASIVGAGSTRGLRSVRWAMVGRVVGAAAFTPAATFVLAAVLMRLATG